MCSAVLVLGSELAKRVRIFTSCGSLTIPKEMKRKGDEEEEEQLKDALSETRARKDQDEEVERFYEDCVEPVLAPRNAVVVEGNAALPEEQLQAAPHRHVVHGDDGEDLFNARRRAALRAAGLTVRELQFGNNHLMVIYAQRLGDDRGYVPAFFVGQTNVQMLGDLPEAHVRDIEDGANQPNVEDNLWSIIRSSAVSLLRDIGNRVHEFRTRRMLSHYFLMRQTFVWPPPRQSVRIVARNETYLEDELHAPRDRIDIFLAFLKQLVISGERGPYEEAWADFVRRNPPQ